MNRVVSISQRKTQPAEPGAMNGAPFDSDTQMHDRISAIRIVLYSHDTMGIGHMRRNVLIASHLQERIPNCRLLLIAGAKEAAVFANQSGIDCLTLPSWLKCENGKYQPRHLGISADELLEFRTATILSAISSFRPDLLIVDKVPQGAGGELLPALEWLSANRNCRMILGLREILDDPLSVAREWSESRVFELVRAYFDAIWIYGDPQVFDTASEYQFPPDIRSMTEFTGYLDPRLRLRNSSAADSPRDSDVLCTLGGGQDGARIAWKFAEAAASTTRRCVLLTGPCMPASSRSAITRFARTQQNLEVVGYAAEGDLLIRSAGRIVAMGGYNTVSAILAWHKPSMIIPRIRPRREQLIRARRFAELGHVSMLHPARLSVERIASWMNKSESDLQVGSSPVDFGGLNRIREMVARQLPMIVRAREVNR